MTKDRAYKGDRTKTGCVVTADGEPLAPRFDLRNHSPDGFEWGYGGSGPAQLALALLADALGDDIDAQGAYQDYKWQVIAGWLGDHWKTTRKSVVAWFENYQERKRAEQLRLRGKTQGGS